jgi:hypothetical protein
MHMLDRLEIKLCREGTDEIINYNKKAFKNFFIVVSEENIKALKSTAQSIRDKLCVKSPFENYKERNIMKTE